jgi:oxygen-independent coproporphyrinogen-3 oxidase
MTLGLCEPECTSLEEEPLVGSYFVAAYPPFSLWRPEAVGEVEKLLAEPAPDGVRPAFGLYVHVPFCIHRCKYCYYLSQAGKSLRDMEAYLDAVLAEVSLYRDLPQLAGRRPSFVYIGGGTPSLLPPESIRRLLTSLRAAFSWSDVEEATFECAPRSVTRAKLREMRRRGINRLSLGIQALDDDVLRLNGRVHLVADIERAWSEIRRVRFDEINIDLMVGLVGETDESFRAGLERALHMRPDSVTIYQLEIPHNTPLYRAVQAGRLEEELPSWEAKRSRLAEAFERLEESGYTLRSAYAAARTGQHRRHRRFVYQEEQYRGADLLGLGASAFSYVCGAHFQNLADVAAYQAAVQERRLPLDRAYVLDREEQMVREFVLQLKLGSINAGYFRDTFAVDIPQRFAAPLERCAADGWLTFDCAGVRLTRAGLLRVDRLLPEFYLPQHASLGLPNPVAAGFSLRRAETQAQICDGTTAG